MAKLEIIVKVDGQEVDRVEFDNSPFTDKVGAYWLFMRSFEDRMKLWSYNRIFGKGQNANS